MYRYLAIVWNDNRSDSVQALRSLRAELQSAPEWSIAYDGPRALVVQTGVRPGACKTHRLHANSGIVVGNLFDRSHGDFRTRQPIHFGESETAKVVHSGGRHIVQQYWGAYVAFLYDAATRTQSVLRDPIGTLPCYRTHYRGLEVFFSDVEDCVRFVPIAATVDRSFIVRWIINSSLAGTQTGLQDVEEPLGGECLRFAPDKVTRSQLWNPIDFASEPREDTVAAAAANLRSVVQTAVEAWASCYQKLVLRLSGGLDSSILAACLAQARSKPEVIYLNHAVDPHSDSEPLRLPGVDERTAAKIRAIAGTGDERYFARLVAERWQTPLIEEGGVGSADWRKLWEAPLKARPTVYFGAMQLDEVDIRLVHGRGIQAFFSGKGGDEAFLATRQPVSAVDYAYLHGVRGAAPHLIAASRLSGDSIWNVALKATKHGLLGRRSRNRPEFLRAPTLLRDDLTEQLTTDDFDGPLVHRVARAPIPPGKRNHLLSIGALGYHHYVFRGGLHTDYVDPFTSQPIWELALQLPTYSLLAGGTSRGLVRRAFGDVLPAEIRSRQTKGSGTFETQQLLRKNRSLWCEQLVDGMLVKEGYVDPRKLADHVASEDPFLIVNAYHLVTLLTAEIWLQQWRCVRRLSTGSEVRAAASWR
jgi:asparagine synthase (glutamine-hydrolysing)